jgi:uncharacterized membrane protein YeiH
MLTADLFASVASAASVVASATATASAAATSSVPDTGTLASIVESVVPSIVASALPSAVTTTAPVTAQHILLPIPFEVAAIFAGALSGAMTAVSRRFDLTGLFVLAIVNGLGGGIMRDVLLQDYGIFALDNPRALIAVLIAGFLGAFFFTAAEKTRPVLGVIDALSLGLFTLVGVDKALVAGLAPLAAILLGTITAIGGGIIRDLLCDREPQVMRRGSLYAVAAMAGSTVFVTMVVWLNFTKPAAMVVAAIVAIGLRLGSLWLGWESPEPVDLTHAVGSVPRSMWRGGALILRRTRRGRPSHLERVEAPAEEEVTDSVDSADDAGP